MRFIDPAKGDGLLTSHLNKDIKREGHVFGEKSEGDTIYQSERCHSQAGQLQRRGNDLVGESAVEGFRTAKQGESIPAPPPSGLIR